jgi:hypothetical protein
MYIHLGIFKIQSIVRRILSRQVNQDGTTQTNQQYNSANQVKARLLICDFPFHIVRVSPPSLKSAGRMK